MLSLNSFIFCQKDIGELTNFFLADKTAAVSAKLKAARVATLSAPLQFHEKKTFFCFLLFAADFSRHIELFSWKFRLCIQDQTSPNSNFHGKTVLIWRDFLETVALFPSQKSTPHSLPLCTLLLVTGSIFLCVLSVQPFTRQFLTEFHQKLRENATSKENIEVNTGSNGLWSF